MSTFDTPRPYTAPVQELAYSEEQMLVLIAEIERLTAERDALKLAVSLNHAQGEFDAVVAERNALLEIVSEVIRAWEALPGGNYASFVVQEWLTDEMKPAIDAARKA